MKNRILLFALFFSTTVSAQLRLGTSFNLNAPTGAFSKELAKLGLGGDLEIGFGLGKRIDITAIVGYDFFRSDLGQIGAMPMKLNVYYYMKKVPLVKPFFGLSVGNVIFSSLPKTNEDVNALTIEPFVGIRLGKMRIALEYKMMGKLYNYEGHDVSGDAIALRIGFFR